jgi:hypothetical protein
MLIRGISELSGHLVFGTASQNAFIRGTVSVISCAYSSY